MANVTTLTISKKSKAEYDELRNKINRRFNVKYAVPMAFRQIDLFDAVVNFLKANEGEFIEYLLTPTDAAFWEAI